MSAPQTARDNNGRFLKFTCSGLLARSRHKETVGAHRGLAAPHSSLGSRDPSWEGILWRPEHRVPTCSPNRVSQPRLTGLGEGRDADQRLKSIGTRDLSSRRPVSSHGGQFIRTLFRRSRLLGDKADALWTGFTAACREEIRGLTYVRSARTPHSRFRFPLLSTSSFALFTQMASTSTGSAAARSTISYSCANAMTASFREVKVDVSESSHDDEIILATRSKTVSTSAREVRGSGDPPIAHPSSLASPKRVTPNAAKPAVASSSASPTRTAPRLSDRKRPESAIPSASTSSTRSIASAALDSRSSSPRRAGESRTTVPQADVDGFVTKLSTEKALPGTVSTKKNGERDRAAPKRLVEQDDFKLDIYELPSAAIRNSARTVSTPRGEPSSRNVSSGLTTGSGVSASKRQKVAPPLVAREEPLSDPRLARSSRSRQEPGATPETLNNGAASQSQSKGKGKGTSLDPPVAAASTTRSGRHVVPARSTPTRTQAEDSSVLPLTSMDESSDDDDYQTKLRKLSSTRGRMLPRARSAARTSNASVSYAELVFSRFDV